MARQSKGRSTAAAKGFRRTQPGLGTPAPATAPGSDPVRAATSPEGPSIEEIEARLALDDHSGALELARARLALRPQETRTKRIVSRCEETLTEMYSGRIGDFGQRVRVAMSGADMKWLSIDHRAGFMLSRVDGALTVDELIEISGMPRLDALRTLHDLLQQKVVELDDGR